MIFGERVRERCCRVRAKRVERNKNNKKGIGKEGLNLLEQPRKDKGNGLWGGVLSFFGCVDPWV